ncbi:Fic family protein [Candidatus Poriferisodalis sp.]|uniref:Fic family protein n=1 Tax=Candidatus Poriferisodalis sp. TaxID=3101277 RepID=UPI003B5AC221
MAVGRHERRFWDGRLQVSRAAQSSDPARECFDAFVPHPINGWEPDLRTDTWRQVSMAAERCADLADATRSRPLAAEWLLDRSESIASSTIEEIRPSARRVARAEAQLELFSEMPPTAEMQALRNVAATQRAMEMAAAGTDLSVAGLCEMHATLMGEHDPIAGRIRDRQNWIGSGALGSPLEARHVGPPPEFVDGLLDDLVAYVNRDDDLTIVRAAIAHAQFETIHPFPDGNGRTGRALIQFMLRRDEVMGDGALPVSAALMLHKERYFDALDEVRVVCPADDPGRSRGYRPWIELLAQATAHACTLRGRLIEHVNALSQRWADQARQAGIRSSSAAAKLLDALPLHPVVTADSASALLSVDLRTAQRAVARLSKIGILEQRSAGRRNRVFECGDMMDAFTESVREQPASNLTLSAPVRTPGPSLPDRGGEAARRPRGAI